MPWHGLHAEAKERFGIKRFRPGQREVLEAVFAGRNVLALMPTGAGKSLCYQLPALFLPFPVIVVSPLIALMRDQQQKAEDAEIAVEQISSAQTTTEAHETIDAIQEGIPQLIYVTPERLENTEFIATLAERGVSLLAVDEAHCISQWGHDFRPAYMNLRFARELLGDPPVIALTATATDAIIQDILKNLNAEDAVIVNTGTERENLILSVEHAANNDSKRAHLLAMLKKEKGTGIVYTASVRSADELQQFLRQNGIAAERYHARLAKRERRRVQNEFMRPLAEGESEPRVLVATKAFGLGIDKPDIRFVYHYEFPDSLETYYQEAGRAGRDGELARAVLFYRLEDKRIQRFFLCNRYPSIEDCQHVLKVMDPVGSVLEIAERAGMSHRRAQIILHLFRETGIAHRRKGGKYAKRAADVSREELARAHATFEEQIKLDLDRLDGMVTYAQSEICRKQNLRNYFGEPEGDPCGKCDNCLRAAEITAPAAYETGAFTLQIGARVKHTRFGRGLVLDTCATSALVRFEKAGIHNVRLNLLTEAADSTMPPPAPPPCAIQQMPPPPEVVVVVPPEELTELAS